MAERHKPKSRTPENRRETGGIVEAGKATRFKPGVCPNPGGRPATKLVTDAIRDELAKVLPDGRTNAQAVAEKLVAMAKRGDVMAIRELTDRTEGKPKATMEINDDLSRLTDEELKARVVALLESAE